ncbi:WS/DGAT domain-containing protein [Nocardia donostiensis]|uniref:O-acyltransferase WSD1 C-terminal domain-containing protein n=1 Tax=Nocardia donostiensis TaxID=1538463 RepID=A0A1W0B5X1_9NOCA|nr:WS/DGAT domain-containing protein [Nocardia donostiensis]ONM47483.1 hypothetical protein B0T46_18185 [Nocardia donostiensis]OQS14288.1 hypothetical protein B0T36_14860 [Nocardia donostiensis]OQS17884.1 hypothetical protein B0T44_22665 [Nocardia donostiensis]
MSSLAPQDATMYWLSGRGRNDLFLLYCFAESRRSTTELRSFVAVRSRTITDLRVRVTADPTGRAYPAWADCAFSDDQFVEHPLPDADWPHLLDALGYLLDSSVDAAWRPWRLHVFRNIRNAPTPDPAVTVAVLQISHALADGKHAADLARQLFAPGAGTEQIVPTVVADLGTNEAPDLGINEMSDLGMGVDSSAGAEPSSAIEEPGPARKTLGARTTADSADGAMVEQGRVGRSGPIAEGVCRIGRGVRAAADMCRILWRGWKAFRAQRKLAALTTAGEVPAPGTGYPPGPLNGPEQVGGHVVRMIVCGAEEFRVPGVSVSVVALTAVSIALERYLSSRGEPVDRLGAQVPMALPAAAHIRNNYRSLGVDLCAGEPDPRRRAAAIAADLAARRTRALHPLAAAQDAVTAALPAAMLRRDIDRYPLHTIPDSIAGHTVVSSVDRGPADLVFGDAPVRFTGGFPALGSVMHLTHGVHGLGNTITVSVHADPAALPDLDTYVDLLRTTLQEIATTLTPLPGPAK